MTTKILVANASQAHLFTVENLRVDNLSWVKDFFHPDSQKKGVDLVCDKSGARASTGNQGGTYEPKHDAKDVAAEHFAIELVRLISEQHNLEKEEKFIIVAPAHFYSLLHKHGHHLFPNIEHIAKDYTKFTVKELTDVLREQLVV